MTNSVSFTADTTGGGGGTNAAAPAPPVASNTAGSGTTATTASATTATTAVATTTGALAPAAGRRGRLILNLSAPVHLRGSEGSRRGRKRRGGPLKPEDQPPAKRGRHSGPAVQPSVNETTVEADDQGLVKALGTALLSILMFMFEVDPDWVIDWQKIDLSDGFWRMIVEAGKEYNFVYQLPRRPGDKEDHYVIPSSLQMGWKNSPAYFCSATEAGRELLRRILALTLGTGIDLPHRHDPARRWIYNRGLHRRKWRSLLGNQPSLKGGGLRGCSAPSSKSEIQRMNRDDGAGKPSEDLYQVNAASLPLPFDIIPDHVTGLKACAAHQIRMLLAREEEQQDDDDDPAASARLLTAADEDCLDDGFCLCDLAVPVRKLQVWHRLFPRVAPFYALKCNPDPMVAAALAQQQSQSHSHNHPDGTTTTTGFDCASISELELARSALERCRSGTDGGDDDGVNEHSKNYNSNERNNFRIVYANPQRAEKDLDSALTMFGDSAAPPLTFDGPEELLKIHRAHQKRLERWRQGQQRDQPPPAPPDLVLRLLVPDEHSSVPLGEKFGATGADVAALVDACLALELPNVIGVSFHCGSGNHDPAAFVTAIRLAHAALQIMNAKLRAAAGRGDSCCWLLDIGGGYPGLDGAGGDRGRFCGSPPKMLSEHAAPPPQQVVDDNDDDEEEEQETTLKIAQLVTPLLDELFPISGNSERDSIRIISEPGRYFVEGAFALCSRIYRVEQEGADRRHYFIAQGVQGVFKDRLLCSETFVPIPLSLDDDSSGSNRDGEKDKLVQSTVHGPSGEDYDVICRDYPLPLLNIGDWLIFDRLGAYTLSIAARNGKPPVRYVINRSSLQTPG